MQPEVPLKMMTAFDVSVFNEALQGRVALVEPDGSVTVCRLLQPTGKTHHTEPYPRSAVVHTCLCARSKLSRRAHDVGSGA